MWPHWWSRCCGGTADRRGTDDGSSELRKCGAPMGDMAARGGTPAGSLPTVASAPGSVRAADPPGSGGAMQTQQRPGRPRLTVVRGVRGCTAAAVARRPGTGSVVVLLPDDPAADGPQLLDLAAALLTRQEMHRLRQCLAALRRGEGRREVLAGAPVLVCDDRSG